MPKRSNDFQDLIGLLHRHLAEDATIEESAELPHRITGEPREVDVVMRRNVAGYEVVIAVEATARRADSPWVESMLQKHAELPTHRLVLVAERGFTKPARELAENKGVAVVVPRAWLADDDAAASELAAITAVRWKTLKRVLTRVHVELVHADGRVEAVEWPDPHAILTQSDGESIMSLRAAVLQQVERDVDWGAVRREGARPEPHYGFKVTDVRGDVEMPWRLPWRGLARAVFLMDADGALARVRSLRFEAQVEFARTPVEFVRRRIGEANVLSGRGSSPEGVELLVVATETVEGTSLSTRARWGRTQATAVPLPFDAPLGALPVDFERHSGPDPRSMSLQATLERAATISLERLQTAVTDDDELLPFVVLCTPQGFFSLTYDVPGSATDVEQFETSLVSMIGSSNAFAAVIASETWADVTEASAETDAAGLAIGRTYFVELAGADRAGNAHTHWIPIRAARIGVRHPAYRTEVGVPPWHARVLTRGLWPGDEEEVSDT